MLKFNGVCKWITQSVAVDALVVVDTAIRTSQAYSHMFDSTSHIIFLLIAPMGNQLLGIFIISYYDQI